MRLEAALAGGFLGTLTLTTILRAASELRLTRIDLPFLLGTLVTDDRMKAKAAGYILHFLFGQLFAVGYFLLLLGLGRTGWILGAALGLGHGLFAGTALVNILLPVIHPRMGTRMSGAGETALLEPPGFLLRNYGPGTPIVSLAAHVAYGAIVGGSLAVGR